MNTCIFKTCLGFTMTVLLFTFAVQVTVADAFAPARDNGVGTFQTAVCPFDVPKGFVEGQQITCGYVTVPENHANPDGATIRIAVVIFLGTGQNLSPDPIALIAGGPGESSIPAYVPALAGEAGKIFLSRRDAVVIEVRGTRYSEPNLVCDEMFDVQLAALTQHLSPEAAAAHQLEAVRACHDRFVRNGINLARFNNVESAADIAMVMTALGYNTFNLYANSAGTLLAQHVLRDYPQRLRSVMMGSVLPLALPDWSFMPVTASETLHMIFTRCAGDAACHAAFPNLEADFERTIDALNARPVTVPISDHESGKTRELLLTGNRFAEWVFWVMYETDAPSQLPLALTLIARGNYAPIQNTAKYFLPERTYSLGVRYSVMCAEDANFADLPPLRGPYASFAQAVTSAMGLQYLPQIQKIWDVPMLGDYVNEPVRGVVPTLLLSGEFDHVTPPRFAERVAQPLNRAYVYTIPGAAHSPIDAGECPLSILLDFLENPTSAPNSDCLEDMRLRFLTQPSAGLIQVTTSGSFVPQANIKTCHAGVSSGQVAIKLSAPMLELGYTLTSFTWDKVASLPFGNGKDAPWQQLHQISGQAKYGSDMSKKWSYVVLGKGSVAFEEKIEDAFFDGALINGVMYSPSKTWNLVLGGGVAQNDFETIPLPAGGFQWNPDRRLSVSVIFPLEAKIRYTSADEKLSASMDAFESSANLTYKLFPSLEIGLGYTASKDTLYQLAKTSPVEPAIGKKYLKTEAQVANVGITYSPFERLTCHLGISYHFDRKFSILDDNEDTLKKFKIADSVGGTFALTYNFF